MTILIGVSGEKRFQCAAHPDVVQPGWVERAIFVHKADKVV